MAAQKHRAETYIRKMSEVDAQLRKELGIDRNDVSLVIRVDVADKVVFNNHEDED